MTTFPHGGDVRGLARALGCDPGDILDFSASINPLGPPEWLRPAISAAVSELVHYPDPHCRELLEAASVRHGIPTGQLLAGNGTSELLFALAQACGHTRAVIPVPSYCDYRTAAERAGMAVELFPMREADDFVLDVQALSRRLHELPGPAAVFLASPNNPTGRTVPAVAIRELAGNHPDCLLVVDEAFGSFVEGYQSLLGNRPANTALLLSLTKMFAIPGLRLGLSCADETLVEATRQRIAPWSVNTLAQAVGLRAVADADFEARTRLAVTGLRAGMATELAQMPGVTVYPGAANYLLCRLDEPRVPELRAKLLEKRMAIRDCSNFAGLDGRFFRLAVRAEADNQRLLDAMPQALAGVMPGFGNVPPRAPKKRRTPALMMQGTSSNAGKSVLTAALCRILRQDGVRVAPFKSQNMSLNSFVTAWGEEMGRAQVLQAQAAGLTPQARMNPVLLKPCSDTGSQVIVMGKPVGTMRVREYVAYKPTAFEAAKQAYDSLADEFDAVILEGAGSPAEVNLKSHDMVNMAMAAYARSRVLLVGDIDRGGVFAALAGTMELLPESERALVGGYVLNRFRGDPTLLDPALSFMRELTGKPVLGVIPNLSDLGLPEEDSVSFKAGGFGAGKPGFAQCDLDIAVLDLPHISNFTDFDALAAEPDAGLRVVRRADELGRPDAVLLPGSKNTLADLAALREAGLDRALAALADTACEIVGICAGLQMLGETLLDPLKLESGLGAVPGLGFLALETELLQEKTLLQSTATHLPSGLGLTGYEIHHGVTRTLRDNAAALAVRPDGQSVAWGRAGRVWGTYLHGVFDSGEFRRWWLNGLRERKGLPPLPASGPGVGLDAALESALDRLAATVRSSLDMGAVYALLGL
ncbi:cobyric acid synthase [Fundidesulfovibrio putealis]|uniref:cobyric acid synthase n=1 Tax=Fundidesulfovibrio putealis TaxID=270496 RepID=UPI0003FDCDEC|nr:cobyric acid synthase [Fundidesulfovibrio putealis]